MCGMGFRVRWIRILSLFWSSFPERRVIAFRAQNTGTFKLSVPGPEPRNWVQIRTTRKISGSVGQNLRALSIYTPRDKCQWLNWIFFWKWRLAKHDFLTCQLRVYLKPNHENTVLQNAYSSLRCYALLSNTKHTESRIFGHSEWAECLKRQWSAHYRTRDHL